MNLKFILRVAFLINLKNFNPFLIKRKHKFRILTLNTIKMKKLLISTAILLMALGCDSSENETQKSSSVTKIQTNTVRYATDVTDDGIENWVVADQPEANEIYQFEYRSEEKIVTVSTLKNGSFSIDQTYTVDSDKNGNITAHITGTSVIFRFISANEVDKITQVTGGSKKSMYIKK